MPIIIKKMQKMQTNAETHKKQPCGVGVGMLRGAGDSLT